jgi:hypothetical protein
VFRSRDGSRPVLRLAWGLGLACVCALFVAAPAAAFGPLAQLGPATPGATPGALADPFGVAIGPDSNVYVSDDNGRIDVFAPGGAFLRAFGNGQVTNPEGLAFDTAGNLYVASEGNSRIVVFSPQGALLRSFGGSGTAAGKLDSPEGVSVDQQGNVYVPEFFNARVSVFTTQGVFKRAFGWGVATGAAALQVCTASCQQGIAGGGAGQFRQPRQAALDGSGNLYVADDPANRVEVFTAKGAFKFAFGRNVGGAGVDRCTATCVDGFAGPAAGQLNAPTSVGVDAGGTVFVTDGLIANKRVSVFTAQGSFLRAFGFDVIPGGGGGFETCNASTTCQGGTSGSGLGQFGRPVGVAFDCRGALYVGDTPNNRVQRFGEASTGLPPCGAAAHPSNEFTLGKIRHNKKRGTALLEVTVPGPGALVGDSASKGAQAVASKKKRKKGSTVSRVTVTATAAGTFTLVIKAKGKARKALNQKGKAKLNLGVTYTPTGGDPNLQSTKIKLIKRRH